MVRVEGFVMMCLEADRPTPINVECRYDQPCLRFGQRCGLSKEALKRLAQHGGVVQMNGETLFELVRTRAGVSLYVTDEDEPVVARSMTARLSITVGGQRRNVAMVPGEGNQFVAQGLTLPKGASVGVLVCGSGQLHSVSFRH